jgi:hypothetical protein
MEDGLVLWVVAAAVAMLVLPPALRRVGAARAEHRARLELRAYVGRRVLADAAFKDLLAGLRRVNPEPGIIDRVLGDTSERDRRRVELLREALGQARLDRRQADRVLKMIKDNGQNEEARAVLRYPALLREELLERELDA